MDYNSPEIEILLGPNFKSRGSANWRTNVRLVIINDNALMCDCLQRAFASTSAFEAVTSFSNVTEWYEQSFAVTMPATILLLCTGARRIDEADVYIKPMLNVFDRVPVVIMGDDSSVDRVVEAISKGARGYLPATIPLEVAVQAIHLVHAGGIYIPVDSLFSLMRQMEPRHVQGDRQQDMDSLKAIFTAREAAVVTALSEGKTNKAIAQELNLQESTVKVHIYRIMRKLKVRNRTEVALRVNSIRSDMPL